jgi:hypothetical protein
MTREQALSMSFTDADKRLALRPDDFRFGDLPEIRVGLEIELGDRAMEIILPPVGRPLRQLTLLGVFQLAGEGAIRFWFEKANVDDVLELGPPSDPAKRSLRTALETTRTNLAAVQTQRDSHEQQLAVLEAQPSTAQALNQRNAFRAAIKGSTQQIKNFEDQLRKQEKEVGDDAFLADRVQHALIPRILQVSAAYRVPGGLEDPEEALYRAFLSEDRREREAAVRLSRRLASAGLFGQREAGVALLPVDSRTYGERQVRFKHPTHGELSLRNLGTGEQQVVLMLAQRVITPYPIAHLEEPEAHLHKGLMEPLARVLRDSVLGNGESPNVDQLWLATHHPLFALADSFEDVSLDETGATRVIRRHRNEADVHF